MPVIEVNLRDLEDLLGKSLTVDDIEKYLPALKCEIELIDDETIEYEASHDRPDLFSVEGLSRALKGLLEIETGLRRFHIGDNSFSLIVRGPQYRPYALGAVVKNLSLHEEAVKQIMNLQEKLHGTYCRNRKKVSIGLYDLDTISPPIYYLAVNPSEVRFIPLEYDYEMTLNEILLKTEKGRMYSHLVKGYKEYPLLRDSNGRVLSFPPIINSEDTKVTVNTRNVFIDVTGTDLSTMMKVLVVMVTSVAERGNPEEIELVEVKASGGSTMISPDLKVEENRLSIALIKRLTGINVERKDAVKFLRMMRHDAEDEGEYLKVKVAAYRLDILHPVDLVEDILMAYGYENISPEPLPALHPGRIHPLEKISSKFRDVLVGLGYTEVSNYMLNNPETLAWKMKLGEVKLIEVENPKMEKYTALRNWLIPGLLEVASVNSKVGYPLKIFEIGDIVVVDERSSNRARSERHLACIRASPEETITNMLVLAKAIMKTFGLEYVFKESDHPSFIPGRFAEVYSNNVKVGFLGEVHPEVLLNFRLTVPVVALEINLNVLKEIITGKLKR